MASFQFDQIGYWSEIKLDIIKEYARAYSTIMTKQPWSKGHFYIDAFAGAGIHISKNSGELVPGSPLNAVNTTPPFSRYYLIDLDTGKAENLRAITKGNSNVEVFEGDCNGILLQKIFPLLPKNQYKRALCILDPYGLHLNWEAMRKAGEMGTIEIFLNFPVADMNRNALWKNRDKVRPDQAARLTAFWGDESWKEVAYDTQNDFFGHPTKNDNTTIAEAFRQRLKTVAGFKHVLEPMPMRNNQNAIVYYLFFASSNDTANKIVQHIFKKYQNRGEA